MKRGLLLNSLIVIILFIVGCSNSEESNRVIDKQSRIEAEQVNIFDDSFLAENIIQDFNGDGKLENLRLYIYPAPIENEEEKGEYYWDDSHLWQLLIIDENKTIPLYNSSINGKLKFWIVDKGKEQPKQIVLLIDGIEVELHTFTYNTKGYYVRELQYKSDGIPPLIRSTTIK